MTFLNLLINPFYIYIYIHIFKPFYIFFVIIKVSKTLSAKYYQEKKKERLLQKKAREKHKDLSKEEKVKKQQYGCERYKNLS